MSEQNERVWENAIAEDFAEFRKAGLRHIASTNKCLARSNKSRTGVAATKV